MLAGIGRWVRVRLGLGQPTERDLPDLLQRLWRLAPYQVAFLGTTAVATMSVQVPMPDVYVKSIVKGELERAPFTTDPKAEIKFRSTGPAPLKVVHMEIRANGVKVKSFQEALSSDANLNKVFVVSSESTPFINEGHRNRHFEGGKSIRLATFRPTDGHIDGVEWDNVLRKSLRDNKVEVEVHFKYLRVPLPYVGPWHPFRGKKVFSL